MDSNEVIRDMRELIYGGGGSVESMHPPPDSCEAPQPTQPPAAQAPDVSKACVVTAVVTAAVTAMALGGVWMLFRRSGGGGGCGAAPAGGSNRTSAVTGRRSTTLPEEDTEPDPLFQPLQARRNAPR